MSSLSNIITNAEQYAANYQAVGAGTGPVTLTGGGGGDKGDFIAGILVVPTSLSPGQIVIADGATSIVIFNGGASSLSNLVSFYIPLGIKSVNTGWTITTGAAASVIVTGGFT